MKISVIITSYNYSEFICDAVDSVIINNNDYLQEIIIVDDFSSDNTKEIIHEKYKNDRKVTIVINTKNSGQLYCMRKGFSLAKGDIICFLDADDKYSMEYFDSIITIYRKNKEIDFIFTSLQRFGLDEKIEMLSNNNIRFGYTNLITYYKGEYIGHPTSSISMTYQCAEDIFRHPISDNDWRIRADDILIFGSSLLGYYKCYISKPLVYYRVHKNNNFFGQKKGDIEEYKYKMNVDKIIGIFSRDMVTLHTNSAKQVYREFCQRNMNKKLYHDYMKTIKITKDSFFNKFQYKYKILIYFFQHRKGQEYGIDA